MPWKKGKWHPVIGRMNKGEERMPYEVEYLYNFREKRDYGIPFSRRKYDIN